MNTDIIQNINKFILDTFTQNDISIFNTYINKKLIEGNIYYHEQNYKNALENYLEIYNYKIISKEIIKNIITIYINFHNYAEALNFINIAIKYFNDFKDYETKYILLSFIDNKNLLNDFLTEISNLSDIIDQTEIDNLINITRLRIDNFSLDQILNKKLLEYKNNYLSKLIIYSQFINDNPKNIIFDKKKEFRYFCYYYTDLFRQSILPEIKLNQTNESVLIEFRCMPHIEFIIRNTINKLGSNWSHTVICGNLNYNFISNICNSISNNIKIIKLNCDNLDNMKDYSIILASSDFWNLFIGDKILIYQEDTCIFKNNIDEFMCWDYIGAPWRKSDNNNTYNVGNGGFSLRTKKIMLEIINKINIENTKYNQYYDYPPEDVYFTNNMIEHNIGKLADFNTAMKFSTEYFVNNDAFGGHSFFLHNPEWKTLMYKQLLNKL